jgi:DNA-binding transcriptional regulator YbjK
MPTETPQSAPIADAAPRQRIIRTALRQIGRDGVAEVSNRRLAEEAGVSLGTLTYHFPSQASLLRESLLLFAGEEAARLQAVAAELRLRQPQPSLEEVAIVVQQLVSESAERPEHAAEIELHLRSSREPELRDASRQCFAAYEGIAVAALEAFGVSDTQRYAPALVALTNGMAIRRLATGEEDAAGTAAALLTIVQGALAEERANRS